MFNAIIHSLELKEIELSGSQFTWASRRSEPTFEKLDRILATVEWEQKFPLVSVQALTRTGSDHTPLLIDSLLNSPGFGWKGSMTWLQLSGLPMLKGILL